MAIALDKEIKAANGVTSDELADLVASRERLLIYVQELAEQQGELEQQIAECDEREEAVKEQNPDHFLRHNRVFVDTTPPAVASRSEVRRIRQDKNEHAKELKDCKKEIDVSQTELQNVQNKIDKASGPFKCKCDQTMNNSKLKRVVYHSGALIGPDVHKVLQPASIEAFGSIFQPVEIHTSRGKQIFGSENLSTKVKHLLAKFADCYKLYKRIHHCVHMRLSSYAFFAWSMEPGFRLIFQMNP